MQYLQGVGRRRFHRAVNQFRSPGEAGLDSLQSRHILFRSRKVSMIRMYYVSLIVQSLYRHSDFFLICNKSFIFAESYFAG